MAFSSIEFLCAFLPVTFILYAALQLLRGRVADGKLITAQNALLLAASLVFYAYGEPVYILLLCVSALANYVLALLLDRSEGSRRRLWLIAAVVIDIGLLCFYKYSALLVGLVNSVFGASVPVPSLALPIGISFYTFQALSYVIDVYRGDTKAQKNFFLVILYISFFPQLIAGPIIKYHDIERQLSSRTLTVAGCAAGMKRFILGLAKKVLIANNVAVAADSVFGAVPGSLGAAAAWIGAIAYMLQIYFDFSGYSDMAIGLGGMFGFSIAENFDHPYVSGSIKEFWRRWHISLSTWFKEYLYIPLGGNRKGRARTVLNKMIVFALTGFWHGANWTFLLWGIYHGVLLNVEDHVRGLGIQLGDRTKKLWSVCSHALTLLAVCIGFVIFRADTIGGALVHIGRMFGIGARAVTGGDLLAAQQLTPLFLLAVLAGVVFSPAPSAVFPRLHRFFGSRPRLAECSGYAVSAVLLFLCILSLSGSGYNPFIYFRF